MVLPLVLPPTVLGYYLLVVIGTHGILDDDAGGLGLLHQIGEREDRVARHHALGVVPAQGDLPAGLAADHARVGDAARQRLAQEVSHQLAHGPAIGRVRQVAGLLRTEMGLRRGHGTHELGALRAGTVEVGEEIARARRGPSRTRWG